MSLVLTSGPAVEPVSLAEVKAHLRIDGDVEDSILATLVITSRLHIEAALGLALIEQSWRWSIDAWPTRRIVTLPLRPVSAVTSIVTRNADGLAETIAGDRYIPHPGSDEPRVSWRNGQPLPRTDRADGIEVAFVAGYGPTAADVPAPIRQALLLLIAHWYEQREPTAVATELKPIPHMVSELLMPFRAHRV